MGKQNKNLHASSKALGLSVRPYYLLLVIAVTIFVSEFFVMLFLEFLPQLAPLQEALIDAAVLSTVVFPTLYFLAIKPLITHIALCRLAEEEKDTLIIELEKSVADIQELQGIIPVCMKCKKVKDDLGFWQHVEYYVSTHSSAKFSKCYCDDCLNLIREERFEQNT